MIQRVTLRAHKSIRDDAVTRGWLLVTSGSVARLAIGFIPSVIIARTFGPVELGVYALLAAVATTGGAVVDLGLSEAAVSRIAPAWPQTPELTRQRVRAFFWLRLGSAAAIVAVGLPLTIPIAARWRGIDHNAVFLALALLNVLGTALSGALSGILQATGRFGRLSIVLILNALLTAIFAVGLRLSGRLTITGALLLLGIGTALACFGLGRRLLPRGIDLGFPDRGSLRQEARALFSFGVWVWLANSVALLTAQMDLLLAGHWLAPAAVGAYALALNLASKADVVNQSLHAALLPTASALRGRDSVVGYLRRGLVRSSLIAVLLLPLFPLARPLIPLIFGSAFAQAAALFPALLGVAIFDLYAAPMLLLAFSANRPQVLAAADALRAVTLIGLAVWLVPSYGVYGLILAKLAARVAGLVLTVIVLGLGRRGERFEFQP